MEKLSALASKRGPTAFLQVVVVLTGIVAMALMLWEPHIEGRNVGATAFKIYFQDPFLAYVYLASTPFYLALYQAFKLLGFAGRNELLSPAGVRALRVIKLCAMALFGFAALSVFFMIFEESEDRHAGLFMRMLVAFPSIVVATAAATFERVLQNALELKSETDLTV